MSETPTPPKTSAETKPASPQRALPIWDVLSEMALYASTALIITGLVLPSIWKPNSFGFGGQEYNLYGIVQTLFESGLPFLGLVVIFFSGIFPLAKTITAAIIFRQGAHPSPKLASLLNLLGISLCPLCGGQLRVIADITEPELITKILNHIQNRDPPRRTPQRALPHPGPNDLFAEG